MVLIEQVGPKRAREMWFMAKFYNAVEADKMGLVNTVVPVSEFYSPNSSKFICELICLCIFAAGEVGGGDG